MEDYIYRKLYDLLVDAAQKYGYEAIKAMDLDTVAEEAYNDFLTENSEEDFE